MTDYFVYFLYTVIKMKSRNLYTHSFTFQQHIHKLNIQAASQNYSCGTENREENSSLATIKKEIILTHLSFW